MHIPLSTAVRVLSSLKPDTNSAISAAVGASTANESMQIGDTFVVQGIALVVVSENWAVAIDGKPITPPITPPITAPITAAAFFQSWTTTPADCSEHPFEKRCILKTGPCALGCDWTNGGCEIKWPVCAPEFHPTRTPFIPTAPPKPGTETTISTITVSPTTISTETNILTDTDVTTITISPSPSCNIPSCTETVTASSPTTPRDGQHLNARDDPSSHRDSSVEGSHFPGDQLHELLIEAVDRAAGICRTLMVHAGKWPVFLGSGRENRHRDSNNDGNTIDGLAWHIRKKLGWPPKIRDPANPKMWDAQIAVVGSVTDKEFEEVLINIGLDGWKGIGPYFDRFRPHIPAVLNNGRVFWREELMRTTAPERPRMKLKHPDIAREEGLEGWWKPHGPRLSSLNDTQWLGFTTTEPKAVPWQVYKDVKLWAIVEDRRPYVLLQHIELEPPIQPKSDWIKDVQININEHIPFEQSGIYSRMAKDMFLQLDQGIHLILDEVKRDMKGPFRLENGDHATDDDILEELRYLLLHKHLKLPILVEATADEVETLKSKLLGNVPFTDAIGGKLVIVELFASHDFVRFLKGKIRMAKIAGVSMHGLNDALISVIHDGIMAGHMLDPYPEDDGTDRLAARGTATLDLTPQERQNVMNRLSVDKDLLEEFDNDEYALFNFITSVPFQRQIDFTCAEEEVKGFPQLEQRLKAWIHQELSRPDDEVIYDEARVWDEKRQDENGGLRSRRQGASPDPESLTAARRLLKTLAKDGNFQRDVDEFIRKSIKEHSNGDGGGLLSHLMRGPQTLKKAVKSASDSVSNGIGRLWESVDSIIVAKTHHKDRPEDVEDKGDRVLAPRSRPFLTPKQIRRLCMLECSDEKGPCAC